MSDTPTSPAPRCMLLRCKSMLVYGENFEQDPDYQGGVVDFWCIETAKGLGPDDGTVSMECCTDPKRMCYREF